MIENDLPDQSAQAGNGSEHGGTGLEENHTSLPDARLAVDEAAVRIAALHVYIIDVAGALGGSGGKGGEPHDEEEAVEDEDGDDIVQLVEGRELLGQDDVADHDPGDERLFLCE